MQAIILAAGMGKRLGALTRNNTKCMVKVNGVRLLERALDQLSALHVSRVVLVIGYCGQGVRDFAGNSWKGTPIVYIENPVYNKTNNIYSLALASDYLVQEDTLLLESDLIFESSILKKLVDDPYPNLACVDAFQSWMDGTVVVLGEGNSIKRFIPKKDFVYSEIPTYYKTVNIYKFSQSFSRDYYVPFLKAYSHALGNNEYYEQVLRVISMIDTSVIKALPLQGEKWYEIDDIQDLDIAESIFCPTTERVKKLQSRYGGYWRYPGLLDFCYLVNPYFPPKQLLAEMKNSFDELLCSYPSGMKVNSLLAGKNFGIDPAMIVVGNGAAELIQALMAETTGRVGFIYPTFEEYANRLEPSRRVVLDTAENGFAYTADDVTDFFGRSENKVGTLVLINPDNPSGNMIDSTGIARLLEWTKTKNVHLILDESFVDFADDSFTPIRSESLARYPQLSVVKSISKSYGVPGLRLGILASGDLERIVRLKKAVSIWNINSFGEFYLQIAEKYHGDYVKACERFKGERNRFQGELAKIPYLRVFPSQANYFLAEVKPPYSSFDLTRILLEKANILIKDCSGKKGFDGRSFVRIAVRDTQDNNRLLQVLQELA